MTIPPVSLTRPPAEVGGLPLPQGERERIVAAARGWIGTPYRHQAALKGVGCDCLGLLVGVWREFGGEANGRRDAVLPGRTILLPPYTPDWAEAMARETFAEGLRAHLEEIEVSAAREGDLVLFRWRAHLPAKHAAILTAPGRMVHAQEGAAVAEVAVSDWWRRRMAYAFQFGGKSLPPLRGKVAAEQPDGGEIYGQPQRQIAELPLSRSAPPTTLSLKGRGPMVR